MVRLKLQAEDTKDFRREKERPTSSACVSIDMRRVQVFTGNFVPSGFIASFEVTHIKAMLTEIIGKRSSRGNPEKIERSTRFATLSPFERHGR